MGKLKTVSEVRAAADRLAKKFADLPSFPSPLNPLPSPDERLASCQDVVHDQMAFVLALSPEQLAHSVEVLNHVINYTAYDHSDTIKSDVDAVHQHLRNWSGEAKDAFAAQMDYLKNFTNLEANGVLGLAQVNAGLYQLAKNTREGYCDFADKTISSIDAAIEADEERRDKFLASLIGGIVKMCTELTNPVALVVDTADMIGKAIQYEVEGSSLDKALQSYSANMAKMHGQYRQELEDAATTIQEKKNSFLDNEFRLFEPMDPNTSVTSPDFDYDDFRTTSRDDDEFSPKVNREREKESADPDGPHGVIQRRLEGSR